MITVEKALKAKNTKNALSTSKANTQSALKKKLMWGAAITIGGYLVYRMLFKGKNGSENTYTPNQ